MKLIAVLLISLNPLHKEKTLKLKHCKSMSTQKCVGGIGGGL